MEVRFPFLTCTSADFVSMFTLLSLGCKDNCARCLLNSYGYEFHRIINQVHKFVYMARISGLRAVHCLRVVELDQSSLLQQVCYRNFSDLTIGGYIHHFRNK